jgi:hypothetical protein
VQVVKGLVIREPWIDKILSGEKTWEMRSSNTQFRGWFGLIRGGSGTVAGVAELVGVSGPLKASELRANIDRHCVPAERIGGDVSSWNFAWQLGRVHKLRAAVPYRHKRGAVRWVEFDPEVTQAIAKQLAATASSKLAEARSQPDPTPDLGHDPVGRSRRAEPTKAKSVELPRVAPGSGRVIGRTVLSAGAIKNGYVKLTGFVDAFPEDVIGGSTAGEAAPRDLVVDWGGQTPAHTDIAGDKNMFRTRDWTKSFFEKNHARVGDVVEIEQTGPRACRLCLFKHDR